MRDLVIRLLIDHIIEHMDHAVTEQYAGKHQQQRHLLRRTFGKKCPRNEVKADDRHHHAAGKRQQKAHDPGRVAAQDHTDQTAESRAADAGDRSHDYYPPKHIHMFILFLFLVSLSLFPG